MNTQKVIIPTHVAELLRPNRSPGDPHPKPEGPIKLLCRCGGWGGPSLDDSVVPVIIPRPSGNLIMNFSRAERHPPILAYYSSLLVNQSLNLIPGVDVFCGVDGGCALAYALAALCQRKYVYMNRDGFHLLFDRHRIDDGEAVALVQDEFDGTPLVDATNEVGKAGGTVVAIFCFYNSAGVEKFGNVPVVCVVKKETPKATSTAERTMKVAQGFGIV